MLVQPSKAQLPAVGETWLISQSLGSWYFAAFVASSGDDFSSGDGTGFVVAGVAPSDPATGTIWMDSASGNALFQWDGVSWKPLPLGGQAIAAGSITGAQIAAGGLTGANLSPTAGITAGQVAFGASDIGGVSLISGTSQPSGTAVGTLWVNPNNGNQTEAAAIAPGQVNFTARDIGGITTSISSTQPSIPTKGDLWYDATDGYALKQWSGSAWLLYQFGTSAIQAGSITAALIAANTITAEQIAAGQIIAGIVDGTIISGAQFVAYGAAGEVLVYSGQPAVGNLIGSWSAAPGIDDHTNNYPAGLSIGGGGAPQIVLSQDANGAYITLPTNQSDEGQSSALYSLINNPGLANQQLSMLIASMSSAAAAADQNQWNILMSAGADDGSLPSSLTIFDGYDVPFLAMQNPGGSDPLMLIGQSPNNGAMQFMPVLLNGVLLNYGLNSGGQTVAKYTSHGTFTWVCPAGVTTLKVECWGAGGGGRFSSGAGGAGGEYAAEYTLAVVPGTTYTIVVGGAGAPGTGSNRNGGNGGPSSFTGAVITVIAHGGFGSTGSSVGATSGSTNSVHFNGGGSADSSQTGSAGGAGGGGAGGPNGAGKTGAANSGSKPGSGGTSNGGGGTGGGGGWGSTSGNPTVGGDGASPGGGGGAGGSSSSLGVAGGAGGTGAVKLTWTNPGSAQIAASFASAAGTDGSGNSFPVGYQGPVTAVNPTASPSVPETWHTAALASGWTAANGTSGLYYRLTPENTVKVFCAATHSSITSGTQLIAAALPSAYWPARTWNIGAPGIPGRASAEVTAAGLIIAEPGSASATECDISGEYPLGL
jgi:hypothetical protein